MKNTWERVIRRGKDLGKISCGADESYRHWLKVRVQIVKVPFCNLILAIEGMFVQASIDMREVNNEETQIITKKKARKRKSLDNVLARV